MKLNWDLIKEILEEVEEKSNGFRYNRIERHNFEVVDRGEKEFIALGYHYKILINAELIEGQVTEGPTLYKGNALERIDYKALTFKGHQTLDAMRNDTVWNQIKDTVKQMGAGGLKQTPSLALAWIMGL